MGAGARSSESRAFMAGLRAAPLNKRMMRLCKMIADAHEDDRAGKIFDYFTRKEEETLRAWLRDPPEDAAMAMEEEYFGPGKKSYLTGDPNRPGYTVEVDWDSKRPPVERVKEILLELYDELMS